MLNENNYWRFVDARPVVGIRPVLEGRLGGIRESLEGRTMEMSRSVVDLITSELKYVDGTPVECIIADTCISSVAEAAACRTKFEKNSVALTLTVTPCWAYGSETMDMDSSTPKAIWGFNGTERPGAVYLAAVLAAYAQKGIPAFGIYGEEVQDADDTTIPSDVREKILRFIRAGIAVGTMKGKSYLSIGSVSMGIAGCIIHEPFFQNYLGMRNEYVDMSELIRRMDGNIYDKDEFKKAKVWVNENLTIGKDPNPVEIRHTDKQFDLEWNECIKMCLIAKDLYTGNPKLQKIGFGEEALGHNAIAGGFQGQRHWTDFKTNGDFLETILNSGFDWNGNRSPYIIATENDSLNAISMLFGHLLSNTAQIFSDVRTYWSPESVQRVTSYELKGHASGGLIHMINSGSTCLDGTGAQEQNGQPLIKPFWGITEKDKKSCLDSTKFCPSDLSLFKGGGFSTDFCTRGGMPVTACRINLIQGTGPVLQLVEGWTVELPEEVHGQLDERTNPNWPTTWFAPRLTGEGNLTDVYSVMSAWGANHAAISFGHIGSDLITLASMLRIPVSMHNVPKASIFRPAVWKQYGMDSEGADYRACQNFGALYT